MEARRRRATITLDAPDLKLGLPGDALAEAVGNLIENALKYGCPRPDATIHLAAALDPDTATLAISVTDDGDGIDPRHHEQVFRPFHRVHRGQEQGMGMGPASVKALMARVGGRVTLQSQRFGGACFTLHLPPALPPDEPITLQPSPPGGT